MPNGRDRLCGLLEKILARLDQIAGQSAPAGSGLSIPEAAKALGVHINTIHNMEARGKIRVAKIGRRRVVDSREVQRILAGG